MNCQIVHDSLHRRHGWTTTYLLAVGGVPQGWARMALGGPWTDKTTIFEFFVLPSIAPGRSNLSRRCGGEQSRCMVIQSSDLCVGHAARLRTRHLG